MTWTLLSHGIGTTSSPSQNTTGANLIIVHVCCQSSPGISDNKGNSFTPLTITPQPSGGAAITTYYCLNPITGSSVVYTPNGTYHAFAMQAFSGAASSSAFDVQNGADTTGAASLHTGSITPNEDGALIVYSCGDAWTGTATVDIGTIVDQVPLVSGTSFALAAAYYVQSTAAAINPLFSFSSARAEAKIAAFKPAVLVASNRPQIICPRFL